MGIGNSEKLGPASIRLAGFQIWVHSRQFPQSQDYWDGNWLNVTAHCEAYGASVWTSGAIINLPEIARWADACEAMYQTLSGEANLERVEPELYVELKAGSLGHISMKVEITPDNMTQEHTFLLGLDQSYLPDLIKDCRKVLVDYPIRENWMGGKLNWLS
jgi:hypothetical protein